MSATPFADTLAQLTRQRGVLGSMVVSEADGIVVDSRVSRRRQLDWERPHFSSWKRSAAECAPWGGATCCW
jgi:predicted regulator of Ras-like GTPase activity (Roadblock/LC7/MglB family)